MGTSNTTGAGAVAIDTTVDGGQRIIPGATPLKRLHYFDGKFLRAPDLSLEQAALLDQVRISNRAGGAGVVHGLACSLNKGKLAIGAGLAIDATGKLLFLPDAQELEIAPLFETGVDSGAAQPTGATEFSDCAAAKDDGVAAPGSAGGYYLIVALHTEAFCGSEEVFGRLCDTACVGESQRPYVTEGILIQALPLTLSLRTSSVALGAAHERSRAASAYFRSYGAEWASLISASGLESEIWCQAAELSAKRGVALALVSYKGGNVRFLDNWIARRERMEASPRHFWAARMAMRPWPVFLAEVLQFQCQLPSALEAALGGEPGDGGPCDPEHGLIERAVQTIGLMAKQLGTDASVAEAFLADARALQPNAVGGTASANVARLIDGGIVELPSAGWLPVDPNSELTVNDQVRAMLGNGVDLRFCVVRPDYVPHAFEKVQHMERISLLQGLDDPADLQEVDILVPNGRIEELVREAPGTGYAMTLDIIEGDNAKSHPKQAIKPPNQLVIRDLKRAMGSKQAAAATGAGDSALTPLKGAYAAKPFHKAYVYDTPAFVALPGYGRGDTAAIGLAQPTEVDLSGAARDETGDDGAYRLRLAGQTPALALAQIQHIKTGYEQFLVGQPLVGGYAGNIRGKPEENTAKLGDRVPAEAQKSANDGQISIWLDFHVDQDPFEIADGARTGLDLSLAWLKIDQGSNDPVDISDIKLFGHLQRARRFQTGALDTMNGTLELDGTLRDPDGENQLEPLRYGGRIRIDRSTSPVGLRLTFDITSSHDEGAVGITLLLERTWSSAEVSTYALAATNIEDGERKTEDLVAGTLAVEPGVGNPGNQMHSAAISALTRIGHLLDSPAFADHSAAALFPPPLAVADEFQVYAEEEDWVLFHRRRSKVCEHESPVGKPLPDRIYHVWRIAAPSEEDLARIVQALQQDLTNVLDAYEPASIIRAEFAPGVQTLRTARDEILGNWQIGLREDAEVRYAAIASVGDAYDEGAQLALTRLANLLGVLSPASPVDEAQLENLTGFPRALGGGNTDGVIALVTLVPQDEIQTVCHDIFVVETLDWDSILNQFQEMSVDTVLARHKAVPIVSEAIFKAGTGDFADAGGVAIAEAWKASPYAKRNLSAAVVASPDVVGDGSAQEEVIRSQGAAIQVATGAQQVGEVFARPSLTESREPCPRVTILFVEPASQPQVLTELHPVYAGVDVDAAALEAIVSGRLIDGSTLDSWSEIGRVAVAGEVPASGVIGPDLAASAKRLLIGDQDPQDVRLRAYSLVAKGSIEADGNAATRAEAQSKAILDGLKISADLNMVVIDQPKLPGDFPAMTLITI